MQMIILKLLWVFTNNDNQEKIRYWVYFYINRFCYNITIVNFYPVLSIFVCCPSDRIVEQQSRVNFTSASTGSEMISRIGLRRRVGKYRISNFKEPRYKKLEKLQKSIIAVNNWKNNISRYVRRVKMWWEKTDGEINNFFFLQQNLGPRTAGDEKYDSNWAIIWGHIVQTGHLLWQ